MGAINLITSLYLQIPFWSTRFWDMYLDPFYPKRKMPDWAKIAAIRGGSEKWLGY